MIMHFLNRHLKFFCHISEVISYIAAVPIGVVASFKRMKKLTRDTSLIVAALKESTFLVSG